MKSKILLVNFDYFEQEKIAKLGIDVDLGYLSNAHDSVNSSGEKIQGANFYSPLAIYEYRAIFIKLTKKPPLESSLISKAKPISKDDFLNFWKYWREKGILSVFLEENDFKSLFPLGIVHIVLKSASGRDLTVKFVLSEENRPFRQSLKELQSLIAIPPAKYLEIEKREGSYDEGSWFIYNTFENLNDNAVGVYFNAKASWYNEDVPSFVILPAFKEYTPVVSKLLLSFSKIYKKLIPEIYEADWVDSDKYYPKEVQYFNQQINETIKTAEKKVEELETAKTEAKEKFKFLRSLLYASGDELKESVIKVLSEIWKLDVVDMDEERKNDLREDILIRADNIEILAEIKGTQNLNPTFTYITQLLTHLLKSKRRDAIGALILNHDLRREPQERPAAYIKAEEEEQLKEIIYIDTRILFYLSLAILDHGMSLEEAKSVLLQKGRVTFDLDEYIKNKVEQNPKRVP